jgi:hypothetical protein
VIAHSETSVDLHSAAKRIRGSTSMIEREFASLFLNGPAASGYISVTWSEREELLFSQLKSIEIRRAEMLALRKRLRVTVSSVYALAFLVFAAIVIFRIVPSSLYEIILSITCVCIAPFLLVSLAALHMGLWHGKLIAVNSILEILALSSFVDNVIGTRIIAENAVIYLRNFRAEEENERRHGGGAVGQSLTRWLHDTHSAYIHSAVATFARGLRLSYVEAANLTRPLLNSALRADRDNFYCLSLYDSQAWQLVVANWIENAHTIVININACTPSLRFEVRAAMVRSRPPFLLVEQRQWAEWVQASLPKTYPTSHTLVYDHRTVTFRGEISERLPAMTTLPCAALGPDRKLIPSRNIDLLEWLKDPYSICS